MRRKDTPQVTYRRLPEHMYFNSIAAPNTRLFRPSAAINWLARRADPATHYWTLNDDAVIRTPGWDERILSLPQGWLGMSDYSPAGGWHTNFPVFTRRHLETFETLFHPNHWGWVADQWICRTYTIADKCMPLGIHILHHQADQLRQRAIYHHQPDDPPNEEQERWARIIESTADDIKQKEPSPLQRRRLPKKKSPGSKRRVKSAAASPPPIPNGRHSES